MKSKKTTSKAFIEAIEKLTKYPEHPVTLLHDVVTAYLTDLGVPEKKLALCEKHMCHLFGHHIASRHDLARSKKGSHNINPWIPLPYTLLNSEFYSLYKEKFKDGKSIWQHLMESKDNPLFVIDTYYYQSTKAKRGKCRRYKLNEQLLNLFYTLCVKTFTDLEKKEPKMNFLSGAYGRTFCIATGIDIASELKRLQLHVKSKVGASGHRVLYKDRGRSIRTSDYLKDKTRVQFPRLQTQAINNACASFPIDMVEIFDYLDEEGAKLVDGRMPVGGKDYCKFMNNFWAVQRMCECKYIAQSPRRVEFYPSYDTRATFGSRTFGNPTQNISSKLKQRAAGPYLKSEDNPYGWHIINYDIESSQMYFLSVILKAYNIDCPWLTDFLANSSKKDLARSLGINVKTLKIIMYALVFGAPLNKNFNIKVLKHKRHILVDEMYSGLVDHGYLQSDDFEIENVLGGAIIEAIYSCVGSKSKTKEVYENVYTEFIGLYEALNELDSRLYEDSYKPKRTKGTGRHWKNSVGSIISEADLRGDARKRKASLRAHILQGMEAAWVYYIINKLSEFYEHAVVCGIEHDGFISRRVVTPECIEYANNEVNKLTSLTRLKNVRVKAKLIEKPFA
ncbi:hypothetical protein GR7B_00126 [Vibrio phage vB_VcorM_GR7B]|nr:hypothetical protein GR7B_00126 [Vibrio phage vB_VcorM_GR7B]